MRLRANYERNSLPIWKRVHVAVWLYSAISRSNYCASVTTTAAACIVTRNMAFLPDKSYSQYLCPVLKPEYQLPVLPYRGAVHRNCPKPLVKLVNRQGAGCQVSDEGSHNRFARHSPLSPSNSAIRSVALR